MIHNLVKAAQEIIFNNKKSGLSSKNVQGAIDELKCTIDEEAGIVANWTPEGNNTQPHRCYYIKHKNSITIFFVIAGEALTSTVVDRVICEDVCGTFGISSFRESFTVGFGLISGYGNSGANVHVGISAKANKITIERMGSDVADNMPVYGQITLVTV